MSSLLSPAGPVLPPEGRPPQGRLRRLPGRPRQLVLQRKKDPPGNELEIYLTRRSHAQFDTAIHFHAMSYVDIFLYHFI